MTSFSANNTGPLVSIIIPAYNAEDFLAETLDSVLSQSYKDWEVVIVDDGSTDATRGVVERYSSSRIRCYYQDNSGGCSVPRNTGIKLTSGEYLCFLDADDLLTTDRLETQVAFLQRHPDVGIVFSDYRNFSERGEEARSHFEMCPILWTCIDGRDELTLEHGCQYLARENFGIASALLMRRSLLANAFCFETSLKSCEDFHFYYRLARNTKVGIINRVGMMRRLHERNMSSSKLTMLTEGIRCRNMLRECEADQNAKQYLDEGVADLWAHLSRYSANHGKYLDALTQSLWAVRGDFSAARVYWAWKSCLRVLCMAVGLHNPIED